MTAAAKKPAPKSAPEQVPEPQEGALPGSEPGVEGEARKRVARKEQATYVVQRCESALESEPVKAEVVGSRKAATENVTVKRREHWIDIATVTVPAKTTRKKVIGLALAESGVRPEVGGKPLELRVLDAASSHVTSVSARQPDPTLELT